MEQDTAIEKNRTAMEEIWRSIPKEGGSNPPHSGEYIRYGSVDPKFLWVTGFVNTERYKLEEWEAVFEDCKQSDGSYLISKEKFISLGKYKYTGPIKTPLDAMKIREGWYDLNTWHEFCVKSIMPSTTLTAEQLVQAEKVLKEQGIIKNGKILIDKTRKLQVKQFLDNYPSPTRLRELGMETARKERLESEAARSEAAVVKTTYEKGAKLGTREKKELGETLLKGSRITPQAKQEAPTFSVKELRKKSKTKKST
jgi:hypothetical protein